MGPIFDFLYLFILPHCKDLHTSIFSPLLTAFCKKPKSKSFVAPSIYMQRDNKPTPGGVYFRTHFQKSKSIKVSYVFS